MEVVQLYVRDLAASVTQPARLMKAFQRVPLAPGESRTVSFPLRRSDLTFLGRDLKPVAEPGAFQAWISPSAETEGAAGGFVLLPA